MENSESADNKDYLPGDPELIDKIVFQLKLQGLFDEFRKECLADVDTKPAYQNLRQRVDSSVAAFLNGITWSPSLNKKNVRENLRKHVYDCRYLDMGVERIVEQVVNPKICSVFMPKVEEVVYQFLGIKVEPKPETEALTISNKWSSGIDKVKAGRNDSKHGFSNIKGEPFNLLPGELEPISPDHDVFSDNEGGGKTSRKNAKTCKIKEEPKDTNNEELSPLKTEAEIKKEKVDDDTSPAFEPHQPRKDGDNSADSELSGISDLTSLGSPKQNNSSDNNESARNESVNDLIHAVSEPASQDKTFDQDESEPMIDASAISPLTSSSVGSVDSPREKIVYDEQMFDEICASYSAQDNKSYDDRFDDDKSSDSDGSDHLRINDSPLFEKKNFNVESIQSSDDEKKCEKEDFGIVENTNTLNDFDFLKENSNFIKNDEKKEESSDLEKKLVEVSQDEAGNKKNDNEEHSLNTDSNSVMAELSHDQLEDSEELSFPKTPTIHYENSSGSAEFESVGELKEKIKKSQGKSSVLEENSVASFEDCLLKSESLKVSKQPDESSLSFNKQTEESNFSIDTDNNSTTSVKDSNFSGKISSKLETSKLYEHNSKERERKHSHHSHKSSPSSRKDSSSSSKEHRRSHNTKSSSKDGRDTPSTKDDKESKSSKDSKDHSSVKDSKESKHSKDSKEHRSSKDSKEMKVLKDGKEPKLSKDSKPSKEYSYLQDVKEDPESKDKLEDVSSKDAKAREKLKESKSHNSSSQYSSVRENKDSSRHSSKYHRSKEYSSKDSSSTSSDKSYKDHHRSSSKESYHSDKTKSSKESEKKTHSSKDASKDKYEATKKTDDHSKKSSEKSKDQKKPDKIHKDRKRKEHCSSMANDRESRRSSDRDNDGSSSNTSHHHSKSTHQVNSTSEAPRGEEPPKKSHKSSHKQASNSSKFTESNVDHSEVKKTYIIFPVLKNPLPDTNLSNNLSAQDNVFVRHENNLSKTEKYPISGKSQSNGSAESKNELFKVESGLKNPLVIFDKVPKIILERCSLDAFNRGPSNDASKTVSANTSESTTSYSGQLNKVKENFEQKEFEQNCPELLNQQTNNDRSNPKNKSHVESSKGACDETEKQTVTNLVDESSDDENVIMDPEYLAKINAAVLPSDSSVSKISKKPKIAANISQVRDKIKKRKMFRSMDSTEIDDEDVVMDPEYLAKINAANTKTVSSQKSVSTPFEVTEKPAVIQNNLLVSNKIEEQNVSDKNLKRKTKESSDSDNFESKKMKQCEKEESSTVVKNPAAREKTESDKSVSSVNTPQEVESESGRNPPVASESDTTERYSPSSFRESETSCDETRGETQETEITTSHWTADNISSIENRIGDQTIGETTATEKSVDLNSKETSKLDPSDSITQSNCEKLMKSSSEDVSALINSEEVKKWNPSELVAQLSSQEITKVDPSGIVLQSSSEESMKSDPKDSLTQLNSEEIMRSLLSDLVTQVSNEESMKSDSKDVLTQLSSNEITKPDPLSLLTQIKSSELIESAVENASFLPSKTEIMKSDPSDYVTQLNGKNSIKLDPQDEVSQLRNDEMRKPDHSAVTQLSLEESMEFDPKDTITQLSDEEIKKSNPKDLLTRLRSFIVSKFKSHKNDEVIRLEPNSNLLNFINSQFLNYVNNFEEQLQNDLKMIKINFTTDYFNFDSSLDSVLRNDYHFEVDRKSYIDVPKINSSDYSYDENSDCYILNKNSSSIKTVPRPNIIALQRNGSTYGNDENILQNDTKPKKIKIRGLSTGELQVSHRSFCSPESLSLDHKLTGGSDQSSQEEMATTGDSETLSPSKSSILNTSDLSKDLSAANQLNDSVASPKYDGDCSTDDSSIPNTPSKSLTAQLIEPALESLLAESGLASLQASEDPSSLKNSNSSVQGAVFSLPLTPESDSVLTHVSSQKSNIINNNNNSNKNNNNNHNKRHSGETNISAKRKPSPINDKNVPPMKQRYALVESSVGKLQRYDSSDLYKPRPLFSQTSRRSRNNNSNDRDSIGVENESDNPLNAGVIGKKR